MLNLSASYAKTRIEGLWPGKDTDKEPPFEHHPYSTFEPKIPSMPSVRSRTSAKLPRTTSQATVVTVPEGITDAHEANWPTDSTTLNKNCPGKAGMFRIDDKNANFQCDKQERMRRKKYLARMYKHLGKGLMAMDARRKKKSNSSPPALRQKRKNNSHLPVVITDSTSYTLSALPKGYGIFQSFRGGDEMKGKSFDAYIYGSHTVGFFTSTTEFIPHLYWVYCGSPANTPCECFHCKKARHVEFAD